MKERTKEVWRKLGNGLVGLLDTSARVAMPISGDKLLIDELSSDVKQKLSLVDENYPAQKLLFPRDLNRKEKVTIYLNAGSRAIFPLVFKYGMLYNLVRYLANK